MKNRYVTLCVLLLSLFCSSNAQQEVNVLSYYAVTNSLDGQPMIDMTNVIRFFPVFAMRRSIESVTVTIYSGGRICSRQADSLDGKRYWEVMLPEFRLGEAIQRVEVEARFLLPETFKMGIDQLKELQAVTNQQRKEERRGISVEKRKKLDEIEDSLKNEGIVGHHIRVLRQALAEDRATYRATRDSIFDVLLRFPDSLGLAIQRGFVKDTLKLPSFADDKAFIVTLTSKARSHRMDTSKVDTLIEKYLFAGKQVVEDTKKYLAGVAREESQQASLLDAMTTRLARSVEADLADTAYAGPSVRKSDIVIESDQTHARILYRNYKTALRKMTALDPAERMGIFRLRYVPFPIVGTSSNPRMNLRRPLASGSPSVFEVGLAFGDAIVPGDELLAPELTWRRLGVAFAITENLFTEKAEILALALTYDFNSYGSIGLGGNFAGETVHGYASLGINKKAFETLVSQLSGLFK